MEDTVVCSWRNCKFSHIMSCISNHLNLSFTLRLNGTCICKLGCWNGKIWQNLHKADPTALNACAAFTNTSEYMHTHWYTMYTELPHWRCSLMKFSSLHFFTIISGKLWMLCTQIGFDIHIHCVYHLFIASSDVRSRDSVQNWFSTNGNVINDSSARILIKCDGNIQHHNAVLYKRDFSGWGLKKYTHDTFQRKNGHWIRPIRISYGTK